MSILKTITVGGMLEQQARDYPDNDAVVYVDRGLRLSYKEFDRKCDDCAKALIAMGVSKGDHVAIWATNCPEWLYVLFGTAKIGAVLVTVNTNYKVFELEYLLRQSDSMSLFMIDRFKDSSYIDIVNELIPELKNSPKGNLNFQGLPFLKNIVCASENSYDGIYTFEEFMELGKDISDETLLQYKSKVDPHDVTNMQYTSGTTGFPKGVMLTHYNIVNNGFCIGECMRLTHKDRLCIPVPFFHCFGLVLAIMACLTHATTMVPVDYYSPTAVMRSIQAEKCTAVHGVPTMYIFMLEHPDFDKYDFSTLRTGIMAGSPCPISVMREVMDKMNMREITISYGQTESSPVVTMTTPDDAVEDRVATVGRHMPEIEVKIVDPETGKDLPPNTQGEIVARGYCVMRGYYKMEEATKNVIDKDGWLHTGDIGMMDERGYFKITGRIKDMIIRGGENIYPREIEELLYTNPKVQDVQVVAAPSKQLGEEVAAFIILKKDVAATEDEIREFVRKNMAKHKVPKYVCFVDEFPMNAAGKILKYKLREIVIEKFNLQSDDSIETA